MLLKIAALFFPCILWSSVYLTFTDDPATTIDIIAIDEIYSPQLPGTRMFSKRDRFQGHIIEHSHFRHLDPNTEYTIAIGKKQLRFKTLPKSLEQEKIQLAICGDVYRKRDLCIQGLQSIAKKSPQAVLLGGDIAYTRGHINPTRGVRFETIRWLQFFELWEQYMCTADGLTIPLLPCVGNHDTRPKNAFGKRGKSFYAFFPQLTHSYYSLSFAEHIRIFCLDTGHSEPMEGKQTSYLRAMLKKTKEPFKIACYHIPAYPSYTSFHNKEVEKVRNLWCPLFDKYHVTAAFEHDNHAFKRTKKIAGEHESPQGTIFLGDGCLGVTPRHVHNNRWYLDKTASINHYFLLTAKKESTEVQAYDLNSSLIDQISLHQE